jgi:hypothetical protein
MSESKPSQNASKWRAIDALRHQSVGQLRVKYLEVFGQQSRSPELRNYPYILFNKSPDQLRRLGALGGKANARNQRARRALVPTPLQPVPPRSAPKKTATEAILLLDAQFPWLRGAEERGTTRRAKRQQKAAKGWKN